MDVENGHQRHSGQGNPACPSMWVDLIRGWMVHLCLAWQRTSHFTLRCSALVFIRMVRVHFMVQAMGAFLDRSSVFAAWLGPILE